MKRLFFLALLTFSLAAFAQDSGLYFNLERDGEGLVLTRNGEFVQFFLYVYSEHQGCYGISVPDGGLVDEGNCHEAIWYLSSGDMMENEDRVEGWLYIPLGLDYSDGITKPANPFASTVGEAHIVGLYILERHEAGWRLKVVRFGEILDEDDDLFDRIYEFKDPLLMGTD